MAASTAITGYGAVFAVETALNSGVFTDLLETTSITAPNASVDEVDVTHMQSPNRVKEFAAGLADYGTVTEKGNHIPQNATDIFLLAWRADGTRRNCRITYPNSHTQTFLGFVKNYSVDDFNPSSALKRTLVVRVAGAVTDA
jgi:hypothetical protein